MTHRLLGKTGLKVHPLAFGGSSLGGVFGPVSSDDATAAVRTALEEGINLFDTAPYYGATLAETMLGRALAGVPRDSFLLATKVGRYGPELADFDFSTARAVSSTEESLRRLGVEYVDLLQVHDIEFGSLAQIVDETLPALLRLKAQGKARFIGITGLHLHLFDQVLAAAGPQVDVVQSYCHLTLLDDRLREHLPGFHREGVGVLSSAPLAMGLLSDVGPPAWHPASETMRRCCREAAQYCQSRGASLPELALRYSAHQDGVAATVVGMATAGQVRSNLRAIAVPPDERLVAEVQAVLAPVRNVTWPSGRPENQP